MFVISCWKETLENIRFIFQMNLPIGISFLKG